MCPTIWGIVHRNAPFWFLHISLFSSNHWLPDICGMEGCGAVLGFYPSQSTIVAFSPSEPWWQYPSAGMDGVFFTAGPVVFWISYVCKWYLDWRVLEVWIHMAGRLSFNSSLVGSISKFGIYLWHILLDGYNCKFMWCGFSYFSIHFKKFES